MRIMYALFFSRINAKINGGRIKKNIYLLLIIK